MSRGVLRAVLLGGGAIMALAQASNALAQAVSPDQANKEVPTGASQIADPPATEKSVAEIVVTGTSIRGVVPTGSNLVSLGRDAITKVPAINTSELLSTLPQLGNFGALQENATPGRFRTSGFQPRIHGLASSATLTLFNGHRVAGSGTEAIYPDPQAIPVIALERVEIVADGASAIYGSDAVAGVLNLIYRRNFDGIDLSAQLGGTSNYRKRDAAGLFGKTWDGGGIMAAVEYSDNTAPRIGDISFIRQDQSFRGGPDRRSTVCGVPNITVGGRSYAYPTFSTTTNRCDPNLVQSLFPIGHRIAGLITAHQDLTENIEAFTEFNYSHYTQRRNLAYQGMTITVPNTSPYFILPPGVTATSITVSRSGEGLLAPPVERGKSQFFSAVGGLNIKLGGEWAGTVQFNHSQTSDFNDTWGIDTDQARALAAAGQFNPFVGASGNSTAVISAIDRRYDSVNTAKNYLDELQGKIDGPLFHLPGGAVRAAVGASYRKERTDQLQTGGPLVARFVVRDNDIDRWTTAVFGELLVPIFGPDNALSVIRKFNLSASGRYEQIEGIGGTFNPKLGATLTTFGGISLQGSIGTSFHAPNLGQTTQSFGIGREGTVIQGVGTVNAYNIGGDNPNLKPERARTYSFGVDFVPTFVRNLRFNATYFHVRYSNLVYQPSLADIVGNPAFANRLIVNVTPAQLAAAIAQAPPQGIVPPNITVIYDNVVTNVGRQWISGIDMNGSYAVNTGLGRFTIAGNALHMTRFDTQLLSTSPIAARLGTTDAIRWKGRGSLSWDFSPISATVFVNFVGKYRNTGVTPNQVVDRFRTVDANISLTLPGSMKNIIVSGQVQNLLDKDPPYFNSTAGYDPLSASPLGRVMTLSLRARF